MKVLLHLGSSTLGRKDTPELFQSDEWQHIRIDSDPETKPDIVGNMVTLEGLDDLLMREDWGKGRFIEKKLRADAIYASHSFEHLHPFDGRTALINWRERLAPGGVIVLHIPDLESAAKLIADGKAEVPMYFSDAGPITPLDMIYGFRGFTHSPTPGMRHAWGYTRESLTVKFIEAGYSAICIYRDLAHFEVRAYCRA